MGKAAAWENSPLGEVLPLTLALLLLFGDLGCPWSTEVMVMSPYNVFSVIECH